MADNYFKVKKGINIKPSTLPISGELGDITFDSASNSFKQWDGSSWETVGAGGGSSIEIQDEGSSLTTAVTKINFVGAGVTVTEPVANEVEVNISGGGSGANTTLSNLTETVYNESGGLSGTQINKDLIFELGDRDVIRTNIIQTASDYFPIFGGGKTTANLKLTSGSVLDAVNTSGHLILAVGSASAGRGKIKMQDGSEGTVGHVWTQTATDGSGAWQAVSGGSIPDASDTVSGQVNTTTQTFGGVKTFKDGLVSEDTIVITSAGPSAAIVTPDKTGSDSSVGIDILTGMVDSGDSGNINISTGASSSGTRGLIANSSNGYQINSSNYVSINGTDNIILNHGSAGNQIFIINGGTIGSGDIGLALSSEVGNLYGHAYDGIVRSIAHNDKIHLAMTASNDTATSAAAGDLTLAAGSALNGTNAGGSVYIHSGNSTGGGPGLIWLNTGYGSGGTRGFVNVGASYLTLLATGSGFNSATLEFTSADGAGWIDVKAPEVMTGGYTITLPATDGTNGQSLTTNGSGQLSYSTTKWMTSVKTDADTGYTTSNFEEILADSTTAAFTINLPASPAIGDRVRFVDYAGTWATNNVTVGRNSNNIQGSASDFTLNIDDAWTEFVFAGGSRGWLVLA